MRDVTDQLRAYGDAVEHWLTEAEPESATTSHPAPAGQAPDGTATDTAGAHHGPLAGWLGDDDRPTDTARGTVTSVASPALGRDAGRPGRLTTPRRERQGGLRRLGREGSVAADGTVADRRRWPGSRRVVVAAAAVAAAVLTVVAVRSSDSSGDDVRTQAPADRPETSSTTPSSVVSPSTAPSTSSTHPQTTSTAAVEPPGAEVAVRPGPETTGPTEGVALVPVTAEQVEALMRPGAVIENVAISGGNVDVVADDVTIRNFRLDAAGATFGFRSCGPDADCGTTGDQKAGFVAEDGEILDTAGAAFRGHHATLRRLDVHDSDAGAFIPLSGVTIEASWWHHLGRGEGSANGVQFQGPGTAIEVRGNFCDLPVTVPPPYGSSACVIAGSNAHPSLSAVVEGNWLDGGNNTVECNGVTGLVVRGNRFGRHHRHGPVSRCPSTSGNVWDDTGQPI